MKETIIIILSALITGVGFLLRSEREKLREIEKQLSDKKYQVYDELIALFFDIIKGAQTGKEWESTELQSRIFPIMQNLLIYGSDNVADMFSKWRRSSHTGVQGMAYFAAILIEIRKDMGNPNTKMNMEVLWGMLLTDYDSFHPQLKAAAQNAGLNNI